MGRAYVDHKDGDGLMAGLKIQSGIPTGNTGRVDGIRQGTLTGLALHKNPIDNTMTRVLVTCQHVMASTEGSNTYENADDDALMYHPEVDKTDSTANLVGTNLDAIDVEPAADRGGRPNYADIATCDVASGVAVSYRIHDPDHSGTGPTGAGAHAVRKIISGTVEPEVDLDVTYIGYRVGEKTAKISSLVSGVKTHAKMPFQGVAEIHYGFLDRNNPLGGTQVKAGDSGGPVLAKVKGTSGLYRMVGMIFGIEESRGGNTEKVLILPASAAEREAGIVFGEPLPKLSLNEMASFGNYTYRKWTNLGDFAGKTFGLGSIDTSGSFLRLSGPNVPDTGGTHPWWNAYIRSGTGAPGSIRLVVGGSPEIDENFAVGRRWGFKMFVRRKDAFGAWEHVLSGEDELSAMGFVSGTDRNAIVGADMTIPLSNEAKAWREYFQPYRYVNYEVFIQGAPANRAPLVSAVAKPNPAPAGSEVKLDVSESTDPDGDKITEYKWTQHSPTPTTTVTLTHSDKAIASFDAPSTAGTLTFQVAVKDTHGATRTARVEVKVLDPGLDSFGTLREDEFPFKNGVWVSSIPSVNRPGRYAKYYVFRMPRRGKVSIDLASAHADAYLCLLSGAGKGGRVLERNDNTELGIVGHSRIERVLDAGDYTIEATTLMSGRTGNFQVGARLMSADATLSELELSAGELSPDFAASTVSYTASVEHTEDTIEVTPTASHRWAKITVNGVAVTSGSDSGELSLLVGQNTISVVVAAEDGTRKTYTVVVARKSLGPGPWSDWLDTGRFRKSGAAREKEQARTRSNGKGGTERQTRWVGAPDTTGNRGGSGGGTTPPPPDPCTPWVETGNSRGHCDDWEMQETRTCTNSQGVKVKQYRWVSWEGPAETWVPWSRWTHTGKVSGTGKEREVEMKRTRTSNRCRTQTEKTWVSDPEEPPETWGQWSAWSDTGNTRGSGHYSEKEQSRTRTSSKGRTQTQTQWVSNE